MYVASLLCKGVFFCAELYNRKKQRGKITMDIQQIIQELQKHQLLPGKVEYKPLTGGTVSRLYLVNNELVVKLNQPVILEMESIFLEMYKEIERLPKIYYVNDDFHFIVYSFIPGITDCKGINKFMLLETLIKEVINHYKQLSEKSNSWGWADETSSTWREFLLDRVQQSKILIESQLPEEDHMLVQKILKDNKRYEQWKHPYLLHGDCGVHNFVVNNGKLSGIIDPAPVWGIPLYDVIYAFCSSPEDLTVEVLHTAVSELKMSGKVTTEFLNQEVIIGLYIRLGNCMKHHPHELDQYLHAWKYWKKQL